MQQTKWFNREFNFASDQHTFPSIVERLSGTPIRLEEKFAAIPAETQTINIDGTWSIKENLGHLIDLEPLWQDRLNDILNGNKELRPADLQNRKTHEAEHNKKPTADLLKEFRKIRTQTIDLLSTLSEEDVSKSALHPRLQTPMRTMDLFLFVAEHDDHHLARITELVKIITQTK